MALSFADIVRLTAALPGVSEGTSYGTPALRVGKKLICRVWEDGETLVVKPVDEIEQRFLLETQPEVYYKTPHYEGWDTILVHLSRVEAADLARLLEECWRRLATKTLLKVYEAFEMTAEVYSEVAVAWLLEPDPANPGVRYFALRDLLDRAAGDTDVVAARAAIMRTGPVPRILAQQQPEGYWVRPGAAYSTKYRGTPWQLIQLDRLGADPEDPRVRAACEYELQHGQAASGGFSCFGGISDRPPPPSLAIHCLHGNLLAALINLGWLDDERVQRAIEWQALAITGEDAAFGYYASGTPGPGFACVSNGQLPCAWGANKALRALLAVPAEHRSAAVERALQAGAEFLLSSDPALADYPSPGGISPAWWRLGTLFGYTSDVLETLENLTGLGQGADPRLDRAFELLLTKRDSARRWPLENTLNDRTWTNVERKGAPSKWVTLRALRTLRRAGRLPQGA